MVFNRPGRQAVLLGCIVVIAATLRLLRLGAKSFWVDEATSYAIAHLDWNGLFDVLLHERANMALYLTALHVWLRLGTSEDVIRGLSVIVSVATVPLFYVLAKRLFGARVGLTAALLLAVNGYHIWHAQDARSYSLLVFLVLLSFLFLYRGIERSSSTAEHAERVGSSFFKNSRWDWGGYVVTSVLAIYSHFISLLVLPAHVAAAACLGWSAVGRRRLIASLSAIALLALPLVALIITGDLNKAVWIPQTRPRYVVSLFVAFAGKGGWPLLLGYSIFILLPLAHTARTHPTSVEGRRVLSLLAWLAVPIALALGISVIKPMFVHRYLLIAFPAFVLLASLGLSRLPFRWIRTAALIGLLGLTSPGILNSYTDPREDWRGASQYILAHARVGDAAVFDVAVGRRLFDYYRDNSHAGVAPEVVFPTDPEYWVTDAQPNDGLAGTLAPRFERVWLVRWQGSRTLEAPLASLYDEVTGRSFLGLTVFLYSSRR